MGSRAVRSALDPLPRTQSARDCQATCRLSTSAIGLSVNAPAKQPNPNHAEQARHSQVATQSPPAELLQARGLGASTESPRRSSRLPRRIYPDLLDPSTSCHRPASEEARNGQPDGCAAAASLAGTSRSPQLAYAQPGVGPPHLRPRERVCRISCTRSAFGQGDPSE
jgi:hypothetical protein